VKIKIDTKILVISDTTSGAYRYQYAFDCVPQIISKLGYTTIIINSEDTDFAKFKQSIKQFMPDLIFCYLQKPLEIIKISGFLKEYHPVPIINWFLEDPNAVVNPSNNINILDATANFDFWFSQDSRMQKFWKTKAAFMPPGFDENVYYDAGLEQLFDVSYIGQLGPRYVTEMYWPYMKELARYGQKAMLCIDRPMGIPLLPKPLEKFIRSNKRREFLRKFPFWKCGWQTPKDEKDKAIIINKSKIHFGLLRVRGDWEDRVKTLLPNYPLDKHGLFYQFKGRLFQAVGAGAMALNEYCPELEDMFDIGKEIVTFEFGNLKEVREKLSWYLSHDDERERIARAGYERGRKQHTFIARIQQIFDSVRKEL
jgi:spore maturation protein CgeB